MVRVPSSRSKSWKWTTMFYHYIGEILCDIKLQLTKETDTENDDNFPDANVQSPSAKSAIQSGYWACLLDRWANEF